MGTAAIVVFLAAIGFYGTQRYLVAVGRREYAIRASLGAGPRALCRLVLSSGFLMSIPGLVVGGMLAFIAVTWLRDEFLLRQILPTAVTICVVIGLIVLVLAASLGPARRAMRTHPAPLLRED
jgi:putative ABC transport system permease protein